MKTLGKFNILRGLGRGGMGEVFLAESGGERVALKLILADLAPSEAALKRFRREIKVCRRLNHPNVVPILEDGVVDGRPFFTMTYLEGRTLDASLKRARTLPIASVLALAEQIGGALAALHGSGVIHRDVKPGNVMVTREGRFVLMDFGLAKVCDAT